MQSLEQTLGTGSADPTTPAAYYERAFRGFLAAALRRPAILDELFAVARVPKILRGLVRPYVERALAAVADWIDPETPDPK